MSVNPNRQTRTVSRVRGSIVVADVVDDTVRYRIGRMPDGRWEVDERVAREWCTLDGSFRTLREARRAVDDVVSGGEWKAP